MANEEIKWYQKKEVWGLTAALGLILTQFPSNTVANQIGVTLNGLVALGATWLGVTDGKKHGTELFHGMRRKNGQD